MAAFEEPEQAPPWREGAGPPPQVWLWPRGDRPALWIRAAGRWRYAVVMARHEYADGRVVVQVDVRLPRQSAEQEAGVFTRFYRWPQDGLRVAHASTSQPAHDRIPTRASPSQHSIDSADA
ncbi:hypothetical protein [Streptomyces sp. WM6378]|uniref:hypothetical protein n=1 Tax=Streptomyces sp. WM6378 TaxID=1415557 RepID=UPI0006AEB0F1|nr:hypothetical protein [Streptomyces sp. WM6378]KOU50076.1 hypothetical protein ADK54_09865 [Streptomyces sp. WM6378]